MNKVESSYSNKKLTGCLNAIIKESQGFFYESYRVQAKYEIFLPADTEKAKFWDGTGIPLFLIPTNRNAPGAGGSHENNSPGAFNQTGIIPLPNFPTQYPWAWVGYENAVRSAAGNQAYANPYGLTNVDDIMCFMISHEIFEALGDDDNKRYRYFDETAFAANHLYFAKTLPDGAFDPKGYQTDANGVAYFPKLLDIFPKFKGFIVEEAGDAVSSGSLEKYNSFKVNGYVITNYPTRQFFNCYDTTEELYDRMGHVEYPCIPRGGNHQGFFYRCNQRCSIRGNSY